MEERTEGVKYYVIINYLINNIRRKSDTKKKKEEECGGVVKERSTKIKNRELKTRTSQNNKNL